MSVQAQPVRLIFDSDMQTDCDDVGALAVLHALADKGEVEILATPVCVLNPWAAPCTDAINTYYGRPDIPIGQLKGTNGVNLTSRFAQGIAQGFPNDTTAASAPDAVVMYRQILASEADDSVTILSLGYMNNLQNLLNSPADAISPLTGAELIAQKVKVWICMGGNFPDDDQHTGGSDNVNFRRDPASVIDCVTNWPGRVEFVGREIGHAMRAGARLSQAPATNPVRKSYELYFSGSAADRHCADIAAVLYAVRGLSHETTTYWGIQNTGSMQFTNAQAWFQWVATPDKDQGYVLEVLSPLVIQELLEDLMLQPPGPVVEQWARFETELTNTQTYVNPYKDVTLNVTYTSPGGSTVNFWGFHDGGQKWKLRFMPDEPGTWQYTATFSDGQPGTSGTFNCIASDRPATIVAHAANPRWFGHKSGEPYLVRSFHAAGLFKFAIDDPSDPDDGEKRKAFLDWAQAQGYNTMSSHFFSTRDATDSVGPKLWPPDAAQFRKVETILDDLSDRGMVAYAFTGFFTNSGPNPTSAADRTAHIRYCLARFGPYWNIIMNVGGFEVLDYLDASTVRALGAEIASSNPFGHLLGAHQRDGDDIFRNDSWCTFATLQHELTNLSSLSTYLLNNHVAGKPAYGQETLWMGNSLQPAWTLTDLRKHTWVHMMSATGFNAGDMNGNNESGFGGNLDLADKIQARHDVPKLIWDFMESIPFHKMSPRQDLRNTGFMLADPGNSYLCYLPTGGSVSIAVDGGGAPYTVTWINAQDPLGDQRAGGTTSDGQGLAAPDSQDWLVYLTSADSGSGPEAHVTGNGIGIVDGDSSPTSVDGTDFGVANLASGSVVRVFTIQNTGSLTLTVGNVTVSGTNAADFSVTVQPASSVAAGSSTAFSVTFDPRAAGLRAAGLSFGNNDPDENPYDFSIQGIGGGEADTIAHYRFEETPGASDPGNAILNYGNAGAVLNLTDTGGPDGRDNTVGGGYGAVSYPGFGSAFDILASGNDTYISSSSGSPVGGGLQTAGATLQSVLQGGEGAFTYEAMVKLDGISNEQNVVSHDGDNGNRGFLFRVVGGNLSFYNGTASTVATIPNSGAHAFAAGKWFHMAVTYSGEANTSGNLKLYWTALDAPLAPANLIGTGTMSSDLAAGVSNKLGLGTTTRSPYRLGAGIIDEVRISAIARSADKLLVALSPVQRWRLERFGTSLNEGKAADDADPDGDGMNNLREFHAGTEPLNAASVLRISRTAFIGGNVEVDFPSVIGKTYCLEHSITMLPDSWEPILEMIAGTGETISLAVPMIEGEDVGFYRIVIGL